MRIALLVDCYPPSKKSAAKLVQDLAQEFVSLGHEVRVISPQGMLSIPAPSYPEIRLALWPVPHILREMKAFRPNAIHIATEGPIGVAMHRYCRRHELPFTTAYHTRYPEYLNARWPIPLRVSYAWLRRFHGAAARTFVSSNSLQTQLSAMRFEHLHRQSDFLSRQRFERVLVGRHGIFIYHGGTEGLGSMRWHLRLLNSSLNRFDKSFRGEPWTQTEAIAAS